MILTPPLAIGREGVDDVPLWIGFLILFLVFFGGFIWAWLRRLAKRRRD